MGWEARFPAVRPDDLLINMADFLLMTKPLELSDFVLSLMTALGQAVERETGLTALTHSYWERLQRFLTAEVNSATAAR